MRIGILGTRGIPNRYGGFEQCAEKLAVGLVAKGHEVWVYNSHDHEYQEAEWNGVHIVHCNDPEKKWGTAGQFIYDFNCFRDARRRNYDVLLQLGYTSSAVWGRWWPKGIPNVVNMDGLEWKRSKYSEKVKRFLKISERWAARRGNLLIADSVGIAAHLKETYNRQADFIPYGAEPFENPEVKALEPFGLAPFNYHLILARMEPENNIETVLDGYLLAGGTERFIVVGNVGNDYGKTLVEKYKNKSAIRFLGAIYDTAIINNLRHFSGFYYHGHSVGGTNPSLLEAMACGAFIMAHDNIFNKSILGEEALYFRDAQSVATLLKTLPPAETQEAFRRRNEKKIKETFTWAGITDAYEASLQKAVSAFPTSL